MKRASSVDIRNALAVVNTLVNAGIDFVPVPVLSDEDKAILARDVQMRIAQIKNESEVNNGWSAS